jgi:CHAT domain-containing protein
MVFEPVVESPPREALLFGGVEYGAIDEGSSAAETADASQVADQAWVADRERRWSPLPWAALEVDDIKGIYQSISDSPEAVVLGQGEAATEGYFRELAPKCRVLHLATHGYFAAEDPHAEGSLAVAGRGERGNPYGEALGQIGMRSAGLLSGLVFARANLPYRLSAADLAGSIPDDGLLTADEIACLPLGGVQLAVLSACESALGESKGGEGLLGIQRAFQVAGVRSTIATLWTVDDKRTRQLMQAFYRNVLIEKQSYFDALYNAQIAMLRELRGADGESAVASVERGADAPPGTVASHGSPRYWAAFTFAGEWRAPY